MYLSAAAQNARAVRRPHEVDDDAVTPRSAGAAPLRLSPALASSSSSYVDASATPSAPAHWQHALNDDDDVQYARVARQEAAGCVPASSSYESALVHSPPRAPVAHASSSVAQRRAPRAAAAPRFVIAGGGGGLTGQDHQVRREAAIPLELVDVVGNAAQESGEGRRVSQSFTRPLADARDARRRRLQREQSTTPAGLLGAGTDMDEDEDAHEDEDGSDDGESRVEADQESDEEAVSTGTVISPNTVVCALATSTARELVRSLHLLADENTAPSASVSSSCFSLPSVRGRRVLTAECGGWLRLRESRTGTVLHQQQLRGGHEATCCTWLLTQLPPTRRGPHRAQPCRLWAVCGLLGGQLCLYEAAHDALRAWPRLTPMTVHAEPVVGVVPMYVVSASGDDADTWASTTGQPSRRRGPRTRPWWRLTSLCLTMDAGGQLALWEVDEGTSRTRARPQVTCLQYATTDWPRRPTSTSTEETGGVVAEKSHEDGTCPPAVLAAATALATTGFLLNQALSATPPQEETSVYLYTCTPALARYLPSGAQHASGSAMEATADTAWYRLARTYHGVERARDGVITSLCALGGGPGTDSAEPSASEEELEDARLSAGQVWAGTSAGVLCAWDARTTYFLRRIVLPSTSPVHALSSTRVPVVVTTPPSSADPSSDSSCLTAGAAAEEAWACQLDGSVTAWHTRTFQLSQVLPLSYPPLHAQANARLTDRKGQRQQHIDAGGAVRVRDAADLAWARYGDPALAPVESATRGQTRAWRQGARQHFTLALTALETVHLRRAWTIATDGSVRTWLIPDSTPATLDAPAHRAAAAAASTTSTADPWEENGRQTASDRPLLDPEVVRAFLFDTADKMAAMEASYEARLAAQADQIRKLETRNRILAEALRRAAETQLETLDASLAEPAAAPTTLAVGHTVSAIPPPLPSPSASHSDALVSLFNDLRARLDDSLAAEEHLQRRLTAHELLSLEERALAHLDHDHDVHDDDDDDAQTPQRPERRALTRQLPPPPPVALPPRDRVTLVGAGGASRLLSSPAIKQSARPGRASHAPASSAASTPSQTRTHSPTASPIATYDFYPSPILASRSGPVDGDTAEAETGDGRRAQAARSNRPIHSPTLLNAWSTRLASGE